MAAGPSLVIDPPEYELSIEWVDAATRRARARISGPDLEHAGTGLYAYLETRRDGAWVPRFQLRQVGAIFEEPASLAIEAGRGYVELLPMLAAQADIILAIPPLEPGEHRIRKDFTIAGTPIRLHALLPTDF